MPELSSVFSLVNYAFVLFFGIVAALYLADIGFCDHKRVYVLTLFFFACSFRWARKCMRISFAILS